MVLLKDLGIDLDVRKKSVMIDDNDRDNIEYVIDNPSRKLSSNKRLSTLSISFDVPKS